MVKQLDDCTGLNREVKAVIAQRFRDAEANEETTFEVKMPANLKSIFYEQQEDVIKWVRETYKDFNPQFRTSALGGDWFNGWNLSQIRQETVGDVPDELIGTHTNRNHNKRGWGTQLNFRLWIKVEF